EQLEREGHLVCEFLVRCEAVRRYADDDRARLLERRVEIAERLASHEKFARSEEHTSELQSLTNLVCRLLLEKKKKTSTTHHIRRSTAQSETSLGSPAGSGGASTERP